MLGAVDKYCLKSQSFFQTNNFAVKTLTIVSKYLIVNKLIDLYVTLKVKPRNRLS